MILREQANIIMNKLNDILLDILDIEDIMFFITDDFQVYNKYSKFEDGKYIPTILTRDEPFVPRSIGGLITDYLTIEVYTEMSNRRAVEQAFETYRQLYHAKADVEAEEAFTQYIGKYQFVEDELSSDGDNRRKFKATLRIEWETILLGVPFQHTKLSVDGVQLPLVQYTYRNDKGTVANVDYNTDKTNRNLVAEQMVLTFPLNTLTANTRLYQSIHRRNFNQTFTIEDDLSMGGIITKDWELKTGIINREEGKVVSFTAIFDIPLPRVELEITYRSADGDTVEGTVIVSDFQEVSNNTLDGRTEDRVVRSNEVRQVAGYALSFVYERDNPLAKIMAERAFKKVNGDRFDIVYKFEDIEIEMLNLVLEKGTHSFTDDGGVLFTVTFVEGV